MSPFPLLALATNRNYKRCNSKTLQAINKKEKIQKDKIWKT